LRTAIAGVALFAFCFSMLFQQMHFIALWWFVTGAIFISGAGAAIIGGLYWKRGTTAAAWSAAIVGASLTLVGILLGHYWDDVLAWRALSGMSLPPKFPLNPAAVAFVAAIAASITYVAVSFLTTRATEADLDALLHRGKYALPGGTDKDPSRPPAQRSFFARLFGFDDHFTKRDKLIAGAMLCWTLMLLAVNVGVLVWQFTIGKWPVSTWGTYWLIFGVAAPLVLGSLTLIWFTIGGVKDTIDFFRRLKTLKRDATDDGRVESSPSHGFPIVDARTTPPRVAEIYKT